MASDNNFKYVYDVVFDESNGTYTLVDARPRSGVQALVNPGNDGNGVNVIDVRDPPGDNRDVLGDKDGDTFRVVGNGNVNGEYNFVGTATTADSDIGVLAKDGEGYIFLTDTSFDGNGSLQLTVFPDNPYVICFMPGTDIATPTGTAAVETLTIGDIVLTSEGRAAPVRWVGRQTVSTLFADETRLPVRITAGALGDNLPVRDLLVSNDHALLVEGVLVQAGALINGSTIVRERNVPTVFTYYHIELDDHSLILAENVPAETFVDNVERYAFDNWAEHQALYPNGRSVAEMDLPRVKAHRQLPSSVRRLVASRVPAQAANAA